ncbi:cytochrome c oxidase assembly protein [Bosea thiooxidans]
MAFGMLGASFAAVPLYDLFCKVTGFGGTPMVGTARRRQFLDRTMSVRFDARCRAGAGLEVRGGKPRDQGQGRRDADRVHTR